MKTRSKRFLLLLTATLAFVVLAASMALAGPLPGAIHTTKADGTPVNGNIYAAKEDVYLNGGPKGNQSMLPDGCYHFQVTSPNGDKLLSTSSIEARKFIVEDGVIKSVGTGTVPKNGNSNGQTVPYTHKTGIDVNGGITVQLFPYLDTPNNGGVYKVWVTPCDKYEPGKGFHGFLPSWSKTDNFKVKGKLYPPIIKIKKFHDRNANGQKDEGEEWLEWGIEVTTPLGDTNNYQTPKELIASPAGDWVIKEEMNDCWKQTALIIDGVPVVPPTRETTITVGEPLSTQKVYEIVFGNVELGKAKAYKFYDKNTNGKWDCGEVPIEGFKITLTGTETATGNQIEPIVKYTDKDGLADFGCLLPGTYTFCEELPKCGNWENTTPLCSGELVLEGSKCISYKFGNVCYGKADFNTKGFWHNKNGIDLIQQSWIDYVNSLKIYQRNAITENYWFYLGFDGEWDKANYNGNYFGDGAIGEISAFLVSNVNADPNRFQLSQQLLAFIFNWKYNFAGDPSLKIDGVSMTASEIVDAAIKAWACGSAEDMTKWIGILDGFNNDDCVKYVLDTPCKVCYDENCNNE